jgi:phosphoglycerate dehydrogenase-like enzyme
MPFLVWIHSITAGVDHLLCPEIVENEDIILTNAKGIFSSTLAEYVMQSCMFFAKSIPKLLQQKQEKVWNQFPITELRGKTMGIVGYGNIGQACARLAKAFGMKIIALRRNPEESSEDQYIDQVWSIPLSSKTALKQL